MKLIKLTFLFFALIQFSAYSQDLTFSKLTGKITNPTANFITIGDSSVAVSSEGIFSYSARLAEPKYYIIKYGEEEFKIFITPAEHLEISFDAKQFEGSLAFKGPSAAANYILTDQNYTDQEINNYFNRNWAAVFSKKEKDFINTLDSLRNLYFRTLRAFEARNEKLNSKFVFEVTKEIDLGFDRLIILYPQQHLIFTGNETSLSASTINYLNSIELDNPLLLDIKNYKEFGNEWIDLKIRDGFYKNDTLRKRDNQWLNSAFNLILQKFKNDKVREFWLYYYLMFHIENQGVKNLEEYIKAFNFYSSNTGLKRYLNDLYQKELENRKGHLIKTYKTVDGFELDAHIFLPKDLKAGERRPAMVFFHGGSWSEGKPDWHFGQSELGFINISVEYRTYGRHGVLPFQQISDTKSFFRWLRRNAEVLGVVPDKIIASGNSAGGHLILCAALLDTLDEKGEDLTVSSKPDFLILNSAVYDLGGFYWFDNLLDDTTRKKDISPSNHIKRNLPPMLIFHGVNDRAVPVETAYDFVEKMRSSGNKVDFYPIESAPHELWFNNGYKSIAPNAKKNFLKKHKVL